MFRILSTLFCIFFSFFLSSSSLNSQNLSLFNNTLKAQTQKMPEKDSYQIDVYKLNKREHEWYAMPAKDKSSPTMPPEIKYQLSKYNTYFLGDTSKKEIYITFDEGYENGYTPKILDILKENNAKAAFFVTTPYIKQNETIIKRMAAEGHLVCNHSWHHQSMPYLAQNDIIFAKEFTSVEDAYKNVTGLDMPKIFRPPMGKYSELSLYKTAQLGYKTVFWSFAYEDWLPNRQPSLYQSKQKILQRTTNGSIMLLHAVSKTNTEILDSLLKEWKGMGYEFKSLNDLPKA